MIESLNDSIRILNTSTFKLLNFYFTPVLPKPPSPLEVSDNS